MRRRRPSPSPEFKKDADARRMALEGKVQELEEAVAFRDEAAEHMNVVRRNEAKGLADGRAAMEACKSQAQIAWDQHEKVSDQLKVAQDELAKTKTTLDEEERRFRLHRRDNGELLLYMHTRSSKVVEALAVMGVTGLPILRPSHSFSLN